MPSDKTRIENQSPNKPDKELRGCGDRLTAENNQQGQHYQELARLNLFYRAISTSMPGGALYVFDRDLRFILAEGSALSLIGYDRKELEGRTIYDLDEHTCHALEPIFKEVLKGNFLQIETEYCGKIFLSKYHPLLEEKGEVELGIVVTHEITEQKNTEEVLREKERQYRELVENANSAIIRWKTDGTITFFNEYAQAFFGYRSDDILGKNVNILVPAKDSIGTSLTKLVQDIVTNPDRFKNHVNENVLCDGTRVWMSWTNKPIFDENGQVSEILAVGSDITDLTKANHALSESEKKLRMALDAAFTISFEWDIQKNEVRRFISTEPALGPTGDGKFDTFEDVLKIVHPDDRELFKTNVQKAINRKDGKYESEFRYIRPNGEIFWVHEFGCVEFNTEGQPLRLFGLSQEITQRKQNEKEIRQLNETLEQKVAERTELAKVRAKQLQNLAIQLIEAEEKERQRFAGLLHDDLQQILASAKFQLEASHNWPNKQAISNVENMLDEAIRKSRKLSYELSPPVLQLGLVSAMKWLVQNMKEQFGLQIQMEIKAEQHFEIESLRTCMFRATQELLFNIVKHAKVKNARLILSGTKDDVVITVIDEGCGFDTAILKKIQNEAGFGLLTIKERLSYLGGSLGIDSAPGKGSKFTLTMPIKASNDKVLFLNVPSKSQTLEAPEVFASSKIRILFVDDHEVMRQGLIELINRQPDIQVVGEAANGREALDLARNLKPHVVFMDVFMPEMNGIEATRRIKDEMPEIRVIALSMFEDAQIIKSMNHAGAEAFLCKSASLSTLLKAIYGIIN